MECVLINLKHDFIMPIKYLHAKIFVFNYICKLQFHVVDKFVFLMQHRHLILHYTNNTCRFFRKIYFYFGVAIVGVLDGVGSCLSWTVLGRLYAY